MEKKRALAVTVVIETTNPALYPENIDVSSPEVTTSLRRTVIAELATLSRVICVMSEADARLMHAAHAYACEEAGLASTIVCPPAGYRSPADSADVRPFYPGLRE